MTRPKITVTAITTIVAAAILTVGIALRLDGITSQGLWSDELYSVAAVTQVGQNRSWFDFEPKAFPEIDINDSFLTWKAAESSPPFFELVLKPWVLLFGSSD